MNIKRLNETTYKIYFLSFITLLALACSGDRDNVWVDKTSTASLTLSMTKVEQGIIGNTQVYFFDGDGSETGQFRKKINNAERLDDRINMNVDAGIWDIALVAANSNIEDDLISPIRNGLSRSSLKMWETKASGDILPSIPEIRTAYIQGQQVISGQSTTVSDVVPLYRNVALVKVIIDDARDLDISGTHKLELTDVPTTLNWAGGLYPDKNNPTVGSNPLTGNFTIAEHPTLTGYQQSDTLSFIVPAHKGSDFLSSDPKDVSTHKLKLNVDLSYGNGLRFEKTDVEIPDVPQVNKILLVKLHLTGTLDITTQLLPWSDITTDADLSQTRLYLDKAAVGLSYKDTIYVNTNASDYIVSKAEDASWITSLTKLPGIGVEIVADLDSYVDNQPRTSYVIIQANNLTKNVPVTQRPDRGTIKASEHKLVFCPVNNENRTVQVNSIGGDWAILSGSSTVKAATPDQESGAQGNSNINFTRTSTTQEDDFDKYYGNEQIVIKNKSTLDTDTIRLINTYIDIEGDEINANAPTGNAQTAVTSTSEVHVYGGSKNIIFDSWDSWIHDDIAWDAGTQTMTMTTDREPNDEARDGTITFHHADCEDYKVTAKVHQDILITIPAFDFFVIHFIWEGQTDVDCAVEFRGNSLTGDGSNNKIYDKKPVGWSKSTMIKYKNQTLLQWGGNATKGQGETVFFNAPVLENDEDSPRKINVDVYNTWYNPTGWAPHPVTLQITAYKGGTMKQDGFNFINQGGELLYQESSLTMVTTFRGNGTYDRGGYTQTATIVYDRVKHSASIKFLSPVDE